MKRQACVSRDENPKLREKRRPCLTHDVPAHLLTASNVTSLGVSDWGVVTWRHTGVLAHVCCFVHCYRDRIYLERVTGSGERLATSTSGNGHWTRTRHHVTGCPLHFWSPRLVRPDGWGEAQRGEALANWGQPSSSVPSRGFHVLGQQALTVSGWGCLVYSNEGDSNMCDPPLCAGHHPNLQMKKLQPRHTKDYAPEVKLLPNPRAVTQPRPRPSTPPRAAVTLTTGLPHPSLNDPKDAHFVISERRLVQRSQLRLNCYILIHTNRKCFLRQ